MSRYVLDASVAAKWYLPGDGEQLSSEAIEILRHHVSGRVDLLVPDLFWSEIGNILWKAARSGRITKETAHDALANLVSQALPTHSSQALLDDAFAIASIFNRTFYDALYVAVAVATERILVTADERLVNALASRFPVRWLGSL